MSKNCIITTVKSKIKGNATSYIEKENEIFIPISKKFTLNQTRAMAQDKVNKINKEYLSEKFGDVVSLNTSYTDGTGINIHPSKRLVDAYEVKEGNKTIEQVNSNRNLEYFNEDEALLEQEQRDFENENNFKEEQKELNKIVENINNIKFDENGQGLLFGNLQNLAKSNRIAVGEIKVENKKITGFDKKPNPYLRDYNTDLTEVQAKKLFEKSSKSIKDYEKLAVYFANMFVNEIIDKDVHLKMGYMRLAEYSQQKPKILITDTNKKINPFYQYNNTIIVGIYQLQQLLENGNYSDYQKFQNLIQSVAQEESIHLFAEYLLSKETVDNIYSEMSEKDIQKIKDIYENENLDKNGIVHEYVRMVVQQHVFNSTTEQEKVKLTNSVLDFISKMINEIQQFLSEIIGQNNTQKTIEDVINFTKGNFSEELDAKIKNKIFEQGVILEASLKREQTNNIEENEITASEIKEGVQELFEENPDFSSQIYEALGFTGKLKVSLGKELEYKDSYVSESRLKNFKKYEVLDENGKNIGTVVIEDRGNKTVILHPELSVIGKGYGKDLYKTISSKLGVTIQEWTEGAISKSDSAKAMWNSLEKEGSAIRIVNEEDGDNFRQLTYKSEITPQQKQQAILLYSQYLEQNPNGSVEQFKDWVDKFNSKLNKQDNNFYQIKNIFNSASELQSSLKNENKTANALGSEKNIDKVLKKAGLNADLRQQFLKLLKDHSALKSLKLSEVINSYLKEFVKESDKQYYKAIDEPLSKELENILINYFDKFHIRRKEIDNLKEKFGVDSVGVFDVLAKTIYYTKNRNLLTLPEEYGHVFVELLGSIGNKKADNPLFKYMFDNIESWDGYQRVYRDYKDKYITSEGNIDIYKIKKEAIGQAIGIALVRNYKNNKAANNSLWDKLFDKNSDFWTKVQEVIDYLYSLLGNVDYVNINLEADKIAKDILSKNYSKLDRLKKNTSNYNLLSYSETIENQNKKDGGLALSFMKWYSDLGNIITGSLAYRLQGTTYRPEIDALHDIDMIVPSDVHKVDLNKSIYLTPEQLENDRLYRKYISEGNYKEARKYKIQGNLRLNLDQILDNEYFKNIKEKYPDLDFLYTFYNQKANAYYITINAIWSKNQELKDKFKSYSGSFNSRLEKFTPEELDQIYLFDFFLRPETSDQYIKVKDEQFGLSLAHFNYSFYEKLNMMGRPKDAYDYQNWNYFDEDDILAPDFNDRMTYFQIEQTQKSQERLNQVEDVFNENPELSKIGTVEQYASYLDTIFPDSKVKEIVYRGGEGGISKEQYYTLQKQYAERYGKAIPTILNLPNPIIADRGIHRNWVKDELDNRGLIGKDYPGSTSDAIIEQMNGDIPFSAKGDFDVYVIKNENQKHTLGSKQDIDKFKEFISNNNNQKTEDYFSNEINKIQEESKTIDEKISKFESTQKIDNKNTSKALQNMQEKVKIIGDKLLSLGFESINEKEHDFKTSSYITFKSKLKELENIDIDINTFKSPDYLIKTKIKSFKNNFNPQKQGELPFNPIELKIALSENEFIKDIADNTFEGLTDEQIKILKENLDKGEFNLNCKI